VIWEEGDHFCLRSGCGKADDEHGHGLGPRHLIAPIIITRTGMALAERVSLSSVRLSVVLASRILICISEGETSEAIEQFDLMVIPQRDLNGSVLDSPFKVLYKSSRLQQVCMRATPHERIHTT
jgi:hypothetical protein